MPCLPCRFVLLMHLDFSSALCIADSFWAVKCGGSRSWFTHSFCDRFSLLLVSSRVSDLNMYSLSLLIQLPAVGTKGYRHPAKFYHTRLIAYSLLLAVRHLFFFFFPPPCLHCFSLHTEGCAQFGGVIHIAAAALAHSATKGMPLPITSPPFAAPPAVMTYPRLQIITGVCYSKPACTPYFQLTGMDASAWLHRCSSWSARDWLEQSSPAYCMLISFPLA